MTEAINWQAVAKAEQRDNERLRWEIKELESSLVFEIDDGMGSRVSLHREPHMSRLVEMMWPLHVVGVSVIACAIERIDQGKRDELRVMDLQSQLKAVTDELQTMTLAYQMAEDLCAGTVK